MVKKRWQEQELEDRTGEKQLKYEPRVQEDAMHVVNMFYIVIKN